MVGWVELQFYCQPKTKPLDFMTLDFGFGLKAGHMYFSWFSHYVRGGWKMHTSLDMFSE